MPMKKILSIILSLLFVLSLAGCAIGTAGDTTEGDESEKTDVPVVSVICDKTTVTAGEEIEVRVHIDNAPRTACFDVYVVADETMSYVSSESFSAELILASNVVEDDPQTVIVRGMVAATADIYDKEVCTIKYKVSEDAKAGTKVSFSLLCPLYQIGFDESGNDVYSLGDNINLKGLVLEVG